MWNSIISRDERLATKIHKINNIDWALYDDEMYNMSLLYYQTLETEELLK